MGRGSGVNNCRVGALRAWAFVTCGMLALFWAKLGFFLYITRTTMSGNII